MAWGVGARTRKKRVAGCQPGPTWDPSGEERFVGDGHRYKGLPRQSRRQNPNDTATRIVLASSTNNATTLSGQTVLSENRPATNSANDDELAARDRRRIARGVHDHAGQYFVGIMLRLAALELLANDHDLRAALRELHTTVAKFRDELRAICAGERCGVPSGSSLMAALADLIPQWEREVGIAARFDREVLDSGELDDETAEVIFRVVQEALTNVAKHASQASQVSVRLHLKRQLDRRMLSLEIEDDGLARSAQEAPCPTVGPHNGIIGMRERVAELGGHFDVRHRVGKGTRVVAMIPVDKLAKDPYGAEQC